MNRLSQNFCLEFQLMNFFTGTEWGLVTPATPCNEYFYSCVKPLENTCISKLSCFESCSYIWMHIHIIDLGINIVMFCIPGSQLHLPLIVDPKPRSLWFQTPQYCLIPRQSHQKDFCHPHLSNWVALQVVKTKLSFLHTLIVHVPHTCLFPGTGRWWYSWGKKKPRQLLLF